MSGVSGSWDMQRYTTSVPSLLCSTVNTNVDWVHSKVSSSAQALGSQSRETKGEDVQEFMNWFLVFFRYQTCYTQSSYGPHSWAQTPSRSGTHLNMNNLVPAWWDWSGLIFFTTLSVFRVTMEEGRSRPGWVSSLLLSPIWAYVVMDTGTFPHYQSTSHVLFGTGIKNPLLLSLVSTGCAPLY